MIPSLSSAVMSFASPYRLFSKARTPSGEATDDICDLTEKYVTAVMVKWRDLILSTDMLKIHGIEDHWLNK